MIGSDEIEEYLERFKNLPPEEILRFMGESRDFFYRHMTPEGKLFWEETNRKRSEQKNLNLKRKDHKEEI